MTYVEQILNELQEQKTLIQSLADTVQKLLETSPDAQLEKQLSLHAPVAKESMPQNDINRFTYTQKYAKKYPGLVPRITDMRRDSFTFREIAEELSKEYPNIKSHIYQHLYTLAKLSGWVDLQDVSVTDKYRQWTTNNHA